MDWKLALQLAGVVLGLLYLWLEYRADIRLWIVGLVMPLVHGALYYKSGLYADCAMQVYYILAGLYGLCVWAKKPKPAERETGRIARTPARMWFRMAAAYAAIHALLYLLLVRFTDSTVPFWDSLTTALCIMAYWMLSRKYVEQWLVWLAVDVVTVGLYLYKDIPLTAGLYLLYSALAACSAMVLGLVLCYAFGTFWFLTVYTGGSGETLLGALTLCVFPYVLPDLGKIFLALVLVSRVKKHLAL